MDALEVCKGAYTNLFEEVPSIKTAQGGEGVIRHHPCPHAIHLLGYGIMALRNMATSWVLYSSQAPHDNG